MRLPILWISFFFRWYDLWIGVYIDLPNTTLYICPIPMCGIKIRWRMERAMKPPVEVFSDPQAFLAAQKRPGKRRKTAQDGAGGAAWNDEEGTMNDDYCLHVL